MEMEIVESIKKLVRPLMALGFMLIIAVGFFMGMIPWESISQLAAAAVAFYFAERAALKNPQNGS